MQAIISRTDRWNNRDYLLKIEGGCPYWTGDRSLSQVLDLEDARSAKEKIRAIRVNRDHLCPIGIAGVSIELLLDEYAGYFMQDSLPAGVDRIEPPLDHLFVPHLRYCSYWGTYSRVLAGPKPWHDGERETSDIVEVNVSPINGWDSYDAKDQVGNIRIRRHGTTASKRDRDLNMLHMRHVEQLIVNAGLEKARLILFGDLLPQIDWKKYREHCNGGADFDLIRK